MSIPKLQSTCLDLQCDGVIVVVVAEHIELRTAMPRSGEIYGRIGVGQKVSSFEASSFIEKERERRRLFNDLIKNSVKMETSS